MQVPERPPITEYPGWFPNKPVLYKRRWVQVMAAGVAAFVLGSSLGGGESAVATDPPKADVAGPTAEDVQRQVDAAVDDAVADAVDEAVSDTKSTERQRAAALVAKAEARGRAEMKAAVRATKADARAAQAAAVSRAVRATRAQVRARAVAAAPAPAAAAPAAGPTDPQYSTCGEANDAGYGPYVSGQDPEYDWYDDRDGDGVVCET